MTSIDQSRRFIANKSRFEPNIEENINVLIRLLVTVDLSLTVQSRATFTVYGNKTPICRTLYGFLSSW